MFCSLVLKRIYDPLFLRTPWVSGLLHCAVRSPSRWTRISSLFLPADAAGPEKCPQMSRNVPLRLRNSARKLTSNNLVKRFCQPKGRSDLIIKYIILNTGSKETFRENRSRWNLIASQCFTEFEHWGKVGASSCKQQRPYKHHNAHLWLEYM